jgi:hypothetical protein
MASGAQGIAGNGASFGISQAAPDQVGHIEGDPDERRSEACARADRLIDLETPSAMLLSSVSKKEMPRS